MGLDTATGDGSVWPLYLLAGCIGIGHRSRRPATPMLAASVPATELPRVMAMNASIWELGAIAGPLAAGLLHILGSPVPFAVAAAVRAPVPPASCSSPARSGAPISAKRRADAPRRSPACASSCATCAGRHHVARSRRGAARRRDLPAAGLLAGRPARRGARQRPAARRARGRRRDRRAHPHRAPAPAPCGADASSSPSPRSGRSHSSSRSLAATSSRSSRSPVWQLPTCSACSSARRSGPRSRRRATRARRDGGARLHRRLDELGLRVGIAAALIGAVPAVAIGGVLAIAAAGVRAPGGSRSYVRSTASRTPSLSARPWHAEPRMADSGTEGIETYADELLALPPEQFTEARNAAAKQLRARREPRRLGRRQAPATALAGALGHQQARARGRLAHRGVSRGCGRPARGDEQRRRHPRSDGSRARRGVARDEGRRRDPAPRGQGGDGCRRAQRRSDAARRCRRPRRRRCTARGPAHPRARRAVDRRRPRIPRARPCAGQAGRCEAGRGEAGRREAGRRRAATQARSQRRAPSAEGADRRRDEGRGRRARGGALGLRRGPSGPRAAAARGEARRAACRPAARPPRRCSPTCAPGSTSCEDA